MSKNITKITENVLRQENEKADVGLSFCLKAFKSNAVMGSAFHGSWVNAADDPFGFIWKNQKIKGRKMDHVEVIRQKGQNLVVLTKVGTGRRHKRPTPWKRFSDSESSEEENESQLEKVNNRNQFLEWLFGLTSESEEESPAPEPVNPETCQPCACGTTNKKIRIVGGKPTQVNQYPWMALLMYNKKFYCGGSLINSKYVLTAAHCVDGFSRQRISVRLLEHDRTTESESTVIERKVSRVIRHSGYNDQTFNNDIALLRLDKEVALGGDMKPVCLPQRGKSFSNQEGLVTGWGVKNQGGTTSPVLHEVTVPIMSNADCRKTKYGSRRITDNMLCAGYPEGKKDACQGDSGGPLHVVNGTIHDVVGVVSWGEGCARPDYPGVYSRVNRYITWITKNTLDACPCSAQHSTN